MRIRGAVLERVGAEPPYAISRPLVIRELDLDEPGPGEVRVRLEAAGVCHSDLSVVDGGRPRPVPMLLGHEGAGVVDACGDGATMAVGQRVAITFLPRCGDCDGCATDGVRPCIPGSTANSAGELVSGGSRLRGSDGRIHHHLGASVFADYAVVDERSVVPVGSDVPPAVAALLGCAVLTGGGAVVNVAPPRPGTTVAVVGLGGVGLAAVLVASGHADVRVVGVDPIASKRAAALNCGADAAVSPDEIDGLGADLVIEAAGAVPAFETAISLTNPGGTTVSVGLPPAGAIAGISPLALVAEGRRIVGSYLGSAVPARDIPLFECMWREGRLPVERLVSDELPLEEINVAMDRLREGAALRQVVVPA
ncbi:MAG: alcohol dehydrogenase catalytic domain-containing protein [Candidatus Nanopelagicales bacterium]